MINMLNKAEETSLSDRTDSVTDRESGGTETVKNTNENSRAEKYNNRKKFRR